jgi:hypothetical protein
MSIHFLIDMCKVDINVVHLLFTLIKVNWWTQLNKSWQLNPFEVSQNNQVMLSTTLNYDILNLNNSLFKWNLFINSSFTLNIQYYNLSLCILIHKIILTCCMRTLMALINKFGMCLTKCWTLNFVISRDWNLVFKWKFSRHSKE